MAPRFPKPAKAKKKASQAPVINFASAEAALASVNLDFDGWMAGPSEPACDLIAGPLDR